MEEVKANKEPFRVCLASTLCLKTPVKVSDVNVIEYSKNRSTKLKDLHFIHGIIEMHYINLNLSQSVVF